MRWTRHYAQSKSTQRKNMNKDKLKPESSLKDEVLAYLKTVDGIAALYYHLDDETRIDFINQLTNRDLLEQLLPIEWEENILDIIEKRLNN